MKKRVLFVDDDPFLLDFYRIIMQSEKDVLEVMTASDGHRALEMLAAGTFYILVSDLRMPGLSGLELMQEVSKRYPDVARIIVSGLDDQEELAKCLGSTHQFLPKPFDLRAFKAALACVGALDSYLGDPHLKAMVSKLGTLPSFPSLYVEIMAEIQREESSLESIAEIVARDPSMTAKLLQIVNSASFGCKRKISTPLDAVQFLGAATVQSLALSLHVFSSFEDSQVAAGSTQKLWQHAVEVATLARSILKAEDQSPELCAAAYTAGLLHDVGKLVLLQNFPKDYQAVLKFSPDGGPAAIQAEASAFGATHAGVGAYLLGLWGLPGPIVEAVAFHHEPSRVEHRTLCPLTAVHAANALTRLAKAESQPPLPAKLDTDYLSAVGVGDRLEDWRALSSGNPTAK